MQLSCTGVCTPTTTEEITGTNMKSETALEAYLTDLRRLYVGDLAGPRASCHDLGFYEGTQVADSRSFVAQTLKCGVEVRITMDEAPRTSGTRVLLPSRWSDLAADDAVGAVAVSAARALGDTTAFGGSAWGLGRNG